MAQTSSILVAYFSLAGGNTRRIAESLAEKLGADLLAIETVQPYTGSYDDVVDQGKREVDAGFEPELAEFDLDPNDYDVICIGTPTWWYTMAPAVRTFMGKVDWSGKTIVPFMTNGGWPGHVIKDLEHAAKGARAVEPMEVQFDSRGKGHMVTSASEVTAWTRRVASALS